MTPLKIEQGHASLKAIVARRLSRSGNGRVGIALLSIIVVGALGATVFTPYDPGAPHVAHAFQSPNLVHLFGTDNLGRDVLTRVIHGARTSLYIGLIPVAFAAIIGGTLGMLAGYFGKALDTAVVAMTDVLLAFPGILLALAIVAMLGPGLLNIMIAVGVSWVPNYARLLRGSVLSAKQLTYIDAARIVGCTEGRIILRHLLPNVIAPLVVLASLGVGQAIVATSALSFIGVGVQPPTPEWGSMLSAARDYIRTAWWMSVFPGLAITMTVIAFNLLGDGLRDALDSRLRLE